jgi:hypothetical protein
MIAGPFDVMKVQAEAAPPIPHTEKGTRLTGLVGVESSERGPAPQAPALPGGNTEGSLNPFSLSERVSEGCDLASGAGHFGITPGHAGAAKEGPGSKPPGPVEQEGSAVNVRSRLELGPAPHAKRLLRAGLTVGAPWLLGASVGRLEG